MKATMPITALSHQSIINGVGKGVIGGLLPFMEYYCAHLGSDIKYHVIHCSMYRGRLSILSMGVMYRILIVLLKASAKIFRLKYRHRHYFEVLVFDWFCSRSIGMPCVLVNTAIAPLTVEKNKKMGGVNVFISGNPDYTYTKRLLDTEEIKVGAKFSDVYSNQMEVDLWSRMIFNTDQVICFDQITAASYAKGSGYEKVVTLQSWCPGDPLMIEESHTGRQSPDPEQVVFGFIGYAVWCKGLTYLLEAWKTADTGNARLLVVGSISADVQRYIDLNFGGLDGLDGVQFLGYIQNTKGFFHNCDVLIVPSLFDAGPLTAIEGMRCGLPLIITDGCGNSRLIEDDFNGFIVPIKDSAAIARVLEHFVANPCDIERLSRNALFKISTMSGDCHLAYDELASILEQAGSK